MKNSGGLHIAGRKQDNTPRGFEIVYLLVSVVFSIIAFIPARILYVALRQTVWGPLRIMLVVGCFFVVFTLCIIVFSYATGRYNKITIEADRRNPWLEFLKFLGILLVCAFLFELIYELGFKLQLKNPTSYIFLIDDSGSMEANDPDFMRYDVINPIMESEEDTFPFAVYSFSNDLILIREMQPKKDLVKEYQMPNDREMGGTAICYSIQDIVQMVQSGQIEGGDRPRIVLLSDGEPTDLDFFGSNINPILKEAVDNNISISTVGLGRGVNESFMKKIAQSTGGAYLYVDNVDQLQSGMSSAMVESADRDLFGIRGFERLGALYVVERILFMGIIGVLIGLSVLYTSYFMPQQLTFYSAIVKGIVAAALLEILVQATGKDGLFMAVYFLLVGMVLAQKYIRRGRSRENGASGSGGSQSGGYGQENGTANDFTGSQKNRRSPDSEHSFRR